MGHDFIDRIGSQLGHVSPVAYALVFVAGFLIGVTPCNLPMVPLIIGYVAGYGADRRRCLTLIGSFALGAAAVFGVFGGAAALFGGAASQAFGSGWYVLLGALCIVIGLLMAQLIKLPFKSGGLDLSTPWAGGWPGAFVLGAVMSLAGSACCLGPVFAILMYSAVDGRVVHGALTLFAFGLGKSVPLVLVGAGVGTFRSLTKAARWGHIFEMAGGVLMVLVGLYFLNLAYLAALKPTG